MRATLIAAGAASLFLGGAALANPNPTNAEDAARRQIEARQDGWQGHQHYLYDREHQPGGSAASGSTTGAAPYDARACAWEKVRVRRSDGTTAMKRMRRCD